MALDRAERFLKIMSQTSAHVGPGTYDALDIPKPPRDLEKRYGFLSGTQRNTITVSRDKIRFPGPGSHNPKEPLRHIPERVSIDYTEPRFKEKVCEIPGPTRYTLPVRTFKQVPRKIRDHPGTWRGPAGKLWLTRPPRSIIPSTVSVPTKRDAYGYDFDENGAFIKILPPEHEPTFLYNVSGGETNFTTLKYKGNFWSRMTGRDEKSTDPTPGPGDYEHEKKKSLTEIYNEKLREQKRATSKQLRYIDALFTKKLQDKQPSPSEYGPPKSCFDKYKKIACKCDKYTLEPPPFGQTAKRFRYAKSDTPAPGTYEAQEKKSSFNHVYVAPFGSRVSRFKEADDKPWPEPGGYYTEVGNVAYESKKKYQDNYRKPVPHVSLQKKEDLNTNSEIIRAAQYGKVKKSRVYHAVFKSKTGRSERLQRSTDAPDPGAYEALQAFKANHDRCEFLCRRSAPPFLAKSPRTFEVIRHIDMTTPGPTHYSVLCDISKKVKGGVIAYSPREKKKISKAPGPQDYCIHPIFTSSTMKRSFNVSLGKSKAEREVKPKPCYISRRLPPKKVLRWFTVPPKQYQHCTTICETSF